MVAGSVFIALRWNSIIAIPGRKHRKNARANASRRSWSDVSRVFFLSDFAQNVDSVTLLRIQRRALQRQLAAMQPEWRGFT
jgi:hypothetical protein